MSGAQSIRTDLKPFHSEWEMDAEWRPITDYDKAEPRVALLRGSGQMVLSFWGTGFYDPEDSNVGTDGSVTWRSVEDSTLDSPLWFEPEQFAILNDEDAQYFVER